MAGEIRGFVLLIAVGMLAVDWAGFMWGNKHQEIAFVISQLGLFIMAHALYTKERK
jgi:uncharacterized membrane protein YhhN